VTECPVCGREAAVIADVIGMCARCASSASADIRSRILSAHAASREQFDIPNEIPRAEDGIACRLCANECRIAPGGLGYCGVRRNEKGRLQGGTAAGAPVQWYYDPLPTNCVAGWVCPGGSAAGYPAYSPVQGSEVGYKNLAVFYEACTFNCLYCQNYTFRDRTTLEGGERSAEELAAAVDPGTTCLCFFGGDPTPCLPHALAASRLARTHRGDQPLRICWETNGAMSPKLLKQMADLSIESGGCVKFDLKAWDRHLHEALCGVPNDRTLENFRRLAERVDERPDPPPVVASTLLVPGYVAEEEVRKIAEFIASLDKDIPYALLGFTPNFYMSDLPKTSKGHARECKAVAEKAGLRRVRIGNLFVLGEDYE